MSRNNLLLCALALTFTLSGISAAKAQSVFNINDIQAVQTRAAQAIPVTDRFLGQAVRSRSFAFNPQLKSLTAKNRGDILDLELFEGKRYRAVINHFMQHTSTISAMSGKIEGSPYGSCIVTITEHGLGMVIEVPDNDEFFKVKVIDGRTYLTQYKYSDIRKKDGECIELAPPPEKPLVQFEPNPVSDEIVSLRNGCTVTPDENESVIIKVLVVYTKEASKHNDDLLYTDIPAGITEANTVMSNSGTNITFQLACNPVLVNYTEVGWNYDIYNLHDGVGGLAEVCSLRIANEADLVCLVPYLNCSGTCTTGIGYVLNQESGRPDIGMCVVETNYFGNGSRTLVHEIGHNMGCTHHISQVDAQNNPPQGLFPSSHGWGGTANNGDKICTVMTYAHYAGYPYATIIPYFSDTTKHYNNDNSEVIIGTDYIANNVKTLKKTKSVTANYGETIVNAQLTSLTVNGVSVPLQTGNYTYTHTVTAETATITIAGTATCGTVGNVGTKYLTYGTNIYNIVVTANGYQQWYELDVTRPLPTCDSYKSMPDLGSAVTAVIGSPDLDLQLSDNVPHCEVVTSLDFVPVADNAPMCMINTGEDNATSPCAQYNYQTISALKKIKVSSSGSYRFYNNNSTIRLSLYSAFPTICDNFMSSSISGTVSSTSWSGSRTNEISSIDLTANAEYYLRDYDASAITVSIQKPSGSTVYDITDAPEWTAYTYIAVSNADNLIKAQSNEGDFTSLPVGSYTVYGASYSSENSSYPDGFIGKSISSLTGCMTASTTSKSLTVLSNEYKWTGATGTDWGTAGNWSPSGPPCGTCTAVIPGGLDNYPLLSGVTEIGKIVFKHGAKLAGQQYLKAGYKAYVQLDYGGTLSRNRWYMLSMPLQEAYAGDFLFGGNPGMAMRLFGKDGSDKAEWQDITAQGAGTPLGNGSPFILWLDDATSATGLSQSNGIIELPYYESANSAVVHPAHTYNDPTSSFTWRGGTYSVSRSGAACQLVGDTVNEPLTFAKGVQGVSWFTIAGNPFMNSIIFPQLLKDNSSINLKPHYQIWTGSGYAGYSTGYGETGLYSGLDSLIAPWQSFILEYYTTEGGTPGSGLSLNFINANIGARVNGGASLHATEAKTDMLSIEAENAAGSVRTVVASRVTGSAYTGRDDMSKMFGDVSEAPDIYTLKNTFSVTANAEMTPVSVSVLAARQGEVATLPLCIRTSYEGEIALHLTGMSRYEAEIALIDRYTDVQADLTGRETYDYTFSHIPKRSGGEVVATEDRFVLQMQYTGATGQMPVAAAVGSVWVNGGDGTVEAFAASPLQRLTVYNLQGAEIRTATPVGATQVTLSGFKPGFYIVRVWTDGGVVSKKLIIK